MNYPTHIFQLLSSDRAVKFAALFMALFLLLLPSSMPVGENLAGQAFSQMDQALEIAYAEFHNMTLDEASERRQLESRNIERAKRYSGSGSYFLDSDGVLVVDAFNPEQFSLLATDFSEGIELGEVEVRRSQFTINDLKAKEEVVRGLAQRFPLVVSDYGIDIETNSVMVNLREENQVLSESDDNALPQEILALDTYDGYTLGTTYGEPTETSNTIDSGNKVKFGYFYSGTICSIGPQIQFNDVSNTYGFLTNAHCTRKAGNKNTVRAWYSPNWNEDVGFIKEDFYDQNFDVGVVQYDVTDNNGEPLTGSSTLYLNGANKTTNPGTITGTGVAVNGETVCIRGAYSGYKCALVHTANWTKQFPRKGEVVTYTNNILTGDLARHGDSGAPMFRVDDNQNLTMVGMLWGVNCKLDRSGVCYGHAIDITKALQLANATLVTR